MDQNCAACKQPIHTTERVAAFRVGGRMFRWGVHVGCVPEAKALAKIGIPILNRVRRMRLTET